MKKMNNHRIFTYIAVLLFVIAAVSCKKMDDYKKYIEDKPVINYTGKVDSVRVFSGKNRVLIKGLLVSDPKIKEARIYWDGRRDSLVVPISRTSGVDTLKAAIANLEDRVYNFEIVTFDDQGNKSVKVYAFGRSYGENYQLSLTNRPIATNSLNTRTNTFDVTFGNVDRTLGIFATELKYIDLLGQEQVKRIKIDENALSLSNVKVGELMSYRSLYLPDTLCLDTFYTDYTHFNPALKFELKNGTFPFARAAWDGSRWGNPADWTVNAATRNAGNNTYGGYELRSGNGALSLEGGWGLPAVVNGKIYQSIELPEGNYKITVEKYEKGAAGVVNLVVSEGTEIPDEANLATQAIAYSSFAAGTLSKEMNFTITKGGTYLIGFLGNMPNTGSYFKVLGNIRLETR